MGDGQADGPVSFSLTYLPAPKNAKSPPFVIMVQPVKMPTPAAMATWMPAPAA